MFFLQFLHVCDSMIEIIILLKVHFKSSPKEYSKSCKISMKIIVIMSGKVHEKGNQKVVILGMRTVLKVNCKSSQKGSQKTVEKVMEIGLQSKYSGP